MTKINCGLPGRITKEVKAADRAMKKDYKEWELKECMGSIRGLSEFERDL